MKTTETTQTTRTTETTKTSWALPGEPIEIGEFIVGIKDAGKGPFMILEDLKKDVEEWNKSQNM